LARAEARGQRAATVNVAVRVPADLAREFERVAVEEERTVSAEIRRLMRLRVAEVFPNGEVAAA
jgi:hypothetical protein